MAHFHFHKKRPLPQKEQKNLSLSSIGYHHHRYLHQTPSMGRIDVTPALWQTKDPKGIAFVEGEEKQ